MTEVIVKKLQSKFWNLQIERLNLKFFKSCVSEGYIPNGMKSKFDLAMDVNNADLVEDIQNQMNIHGSKLLDIIVIQSQENEVTYKNYFEKAKGPNQFNQEGGL